ncbi:lipid A biosynthesis acyltransferase [Marinomonas sp. RSW2]|uniref:Lipid A biosynthesis acyltransferase n=1 Tax=Marinomonas maritima TaxID=2940935 RepID=A0ABT5WAE7_9GAMM|nr:lipid A biosynthesis acyltransferase [Marinomonas maritima]MDE8601682.1 lipid A biosynthesis acyltransferase [Marinomonas maritima]
MDNQPKHWSTITETGTVVGMRILLMCYRLFGHKGFRLLLAPVILYFYFRKHATRAASKEYLQKITPFLPEHKRKKLTPFRHFWMFGEVLLDKFLVWMGRIKPQDVVFETPDTFQKIEASKLGGIIVVSHLGNTEICSALAHQLPDIKVTMLVYTQHAKKFNKMLQRTNANAAINLIQVTDMSPATAMILSERVAAGEFIVIAGDRTPVNNGGRVSIVDFLGAQAALPQGAFILASLLRCPVYLMFCLKQDSAYHIYMETFSDKLSFARKEREQKLEEAVTLYAKRLEYYCQLAPLQWFNFFPFWHVESKNQQTLINNRDT